MDIGSNYLSLSSYRTSSTTVQSTQSKATLEQIPPEQFSEALRNLKSVDVTLFALPEGDYTPMEVFHGNNLHVIMPQSEHTERISGVLNRLPDDQAKTLVDLGLIDDKEFIKWASELSDTDLGNFADAATALQTPAKHAGIQHFSRSGAPVVKDFAQRLMNMDSDVASDVLQKASELSQGVPSRAPSSTYSSAGLFDNASEAANDLHNFILAINQTDVEESGSQASEILESLGSFAEDQQSDLLQILGSDTKLGLRLMTQLSNNQKETQDNVISYVSDLTKRLSPFALSAPATAPNDSLGEGEWHGAILNYDANAKSVGLGMIDQFISLSETYEFTDEQLNKMTGELSKLDNQDQRSYLDITSVGLSKLLGSDASEPIKLSNHKDALEVVDQLRNNSNARTLISESRMGEKKVSEDGRAYYAVKGESDGIRDQTETIELLTTNAWFNRQEPDRINGLANKLADLDAAQRDELVDELRTLNGADKPLVKITEAEKNDKLGALLQRTDTILRSNSLKDLLSAADKLPEEQQQSFWKAAAFLGEKLNDFVGVVNSVADHEAELLTAYISSLADTAAAEEDIPGNALKQANQAIDDFLERDKD